MFMSVEMPNGRLDCGNQGFPAGPPPAAGHENAPPAAQKERFRGVRIFDITNIRMPRQVAAVQTCRGSHTHTLVVDPKDKNNVYIMSRELRSSVRRRVSRMLGRGRAAKIGLPRFFASM
jgi:hypothetical protein